MDTFTKAYIEAALWSSVGDNDEPLDKNYSIQDISSETLQKMEADCAKFQKENVTDIAQYDHPSFSPEEMAGHDFWLTRNGHGVGFWDRDDCLPESAGERLTVAANAFGECDLYVGDDKLIYC
jgi:hypothetical protein